MAERARGLCPSSNVVSLFDLGHRPSGAAERVDRTMNLKNRVNGLQEYCRPAGARTLLNAQILAAVAGRGRSSQGDWLSLPLREAELGYYDILPLFATPNKSDSIQTPLPFSGHAISVRALV
jgi:hypothetical protein